MYDEKNTEQKLQDFDFKNLTTNIQDLTEEVPTETIIPSVTSNTVGTKIGEVIKCERLNIRSKPNKNSEILKIVSKGTKLGLNGKTDGEWIRVYMDDVKGFVMGSFIKVI